MYRHWPTGRGIFLVGSTAHNVSGAHRASCKKKDVTFIWINEVDHLKVVVGRKDSDLLTTFNTAHQVLQQIEAVVDVTKDTQVGIIFF